MCLVLTLNTETCTDLPGNLEVWLEEAFIVKGLKSPRILNFPKFMPCCANYVLHEAWIFQQFWEAAVFRWRATRKMKSTSKEIKKKLNIFCHLPEKVLQELPQELCAKKWRQTFSWCRFYFGILPLAGSISFIVLLFVGSTLKQLLNAIQLPKKLEGDLCTAGTVSKSTKYGRFQ